MTYKWTLPEVDEVEMPMIHVLLDQIGQMPPNDFLANAKIKAQMEQVKREQSSALSSFATVKGEVRKRPDGY